MEIQYFGGNCVKISGKKSTVVVDDNLAALGQKSIVTNKDIVLFTQPEHAALDGHFMIDCPGEYEVSEVSIIGVAARAHIDETETLRNTMYRVVIDDTRIAIVGHIHPDLSEQQLETLGTVDVLIVPVGGSGYTLDGVGAHKVISKIDPKLVIPTHYHDAKLKYEVPQSELEEALKSVSIEPSETVESLKLKNIEYGESTKLIVINRK